DGRPAWSPDGSIIVFETEQTVSLSGQERQPGDIFVMKPDGTDLRRLTEDSAPDYAAVWSPDGALIAFSSNRHANADIFIIGRDGSGLRQLTASPAMEELPVWSPDGAHLAFESEANG